MPLIDKRRLRRRHGTDADRYRAYRERQKAREDELKQLRDALSSAAERGRSARLTNHLPDPPGEWIPELVRRLEEGRIVFVGREEKK